MMAADGWVITIAGDDTKGGPSGGMVRLLPVPDHWYGGWAGGTGRGRFLAQTAGAELAAISLRCAADTGEELHHADWVITADPAKIREIGATIPDGTPRDGPDALVAWMDDGPGREVACGLLRWLARPPADRRYPFTDPISGATRDLVIPATGPAGVAHPGCDELADVSLNLDAFWCRACRRGGRVSGAWVHDLLEARVTMPAEPPG